MLGSTFTSSIVTVFLLSFLHRGQSKGVDVKSIQRRATQDKVMARTNTTVRLAALRKEMEALGLDAYIVPSTDAHQSEYISLHDSRRQYISGFTGSAGEAVITKTKASLWTDGRYYEQARMQLDSNWVLMKASTAGTPKIYQWLSTYVQKVLLPKLRSRVKLQSAEFSCYFAVLQKGNKVGVDPYLMNTRKFKTYTKNLNGSGLHLLPVTPNLVDEIWTEQPASPNGTLFVLSLKYTGKTWQEKVTDLRADMKTYGATAVVLYELDEIAWLLNLRGTDIPYNPVFISYVIATADQVMLFINKNKTTAEVRAHLSVDSCSSMCVSLKDYGKLLDEIKALAVANNSKIWISPYCSQALVMHSPENTLLLKISPITLPKSIKNSVEIKGMMKANVKDAAAISEFFHWMEKEVPKGRSDMTELSASAKLENFKSMEEDYMGPSFFSIFGFGPNGAIIHYMPTKASDLQITTDSTLLVDTGSQYRDGTCDTTRTVHFGTPTAEQKKAYTRILKGQIAIARMIWPNTTQGRYFDILARKELWAEGLDFNHGIGHGIGMFLNVHEGPQSIGGGCPSSNEHPIVPGMFTSDEPGYYKVGHYGIRLETVLLAVPAKVESHVDGKYFIAFEPANLTPYEKKFIIVDMLTGPELDWLNAFHRESRSKVGDLLKKQGKKEVYDWLVDKTEPLKKDYRPVAGAGHQTATAILVFSGLFFFCFNL